MSEAPSGDYPERSWNDAQLVEASSLQSMTGHHAERMVGHRAASELMRRLMVELTQLRVTSDRSGRRIERLTQALVFLTVVLVILTLAVLMRGAA